MLNGSTSRTEIPTAWSQTLELWNLKAAVENLKRILNSMVLQYCHYDPLTNEGNHNNHLVTNTTSCSQTYIQHTDFVARDMTCSMINTLGYGKVPAE